ncbi:hypothetical protein [Sabulicella glaciei]|uniref:Uncharacterized protein n=1 Tax=Sabulicella glaciei TaxID=2984948 RepID=A0ABT3P083_9PROT|nr:hypothetical protein [Roseococcus sp. MDT2-1-1]MCW8087822.1 hypothetical protein [Roseococcus sp. MDT2-1-1]
MIPADECEWESRCAWIAALVPALRRAPQALPIGWLGLVEDAAEQLAAAGLGDVLSHAHLREKFGGIDVAAKPAPEANPLRVKAAQAILAQLSDASRRTCARHGTPDGRLRTLGTWKVTRGERAWAEAQAHGRSTCTPSPGPLKAAVRGPQGTEP